MKIDVLETIALALANDFKEGCTDALKEILEQNESIIKNNEIYESVGLALAKSIEVLEKSEKLTEESKKKLDYLGEILSHIEKNFESILDIVLQLNAEYSNTMIMKLAYSEKYQERVRKHLITSFNTYLSNGQIVNMVIGLHEFNPNIVGKLASKLDKLGKKFQKGEITEKEFDHQKEDYFGVILKILNTGNVTEINTSFFQNVFSVQSDYRTDFSILNILREYLEDEEISKYVDKSIVFDSLVEKGNYPILDAWVKKEKFFPSEVKEAKDSLVEIFKKMTKLKTFVHHILEEHQENKNWISLLKDFVTDIDYDCLLARCFPGDIVDIITECMEIPSMDIQIEEVIIEANITIEKILEKSKKLEVDENYCENFLFSLLEKDCYTSSIKKILRDFDIDLAYQPMSIYGAQSLMYWIASLGNKEVLSTFISKENLPSTFYGMGQNITLCSLCFKTENIEKGLQEYQKLDLFNDEEKLYLVNFGKFEVKYEEMFEYQDKLTQIINSILEMENVDEQTKKNLIAIILLNKKVEFVNLGLFEILSDFYTKEELKILYKNLKNCTFISYRKDEDLGVDRVVAVEVSDEVKIEDVVFYFIGENIVLKRTQKN